MYQQQESTGAMFENSKQNEKQPDFTGTLTINGKCYRVAAWERQGTKGKWYSMKYSDYEQKPHIEGKPEIKADYKKEELPKEINEDLPF